MKNQDSVGCPCWSGQPYTSCCQPYHLGEKPATAEALMRSRYSAYAKGLPDYIRLTTDVNNPRFSKDWKKWKKDILLFSSQTHFQGLEILESMEKENEAWVTFHAILSQNERDCSFKEKSYFIKIDGMWLYRDGTILSRI